MVHERPVDSALARSNITRNSLRRRSGGDLGAEYFRRPRGEMRRTFRPYGKVPRTHLPGAVAGLSLGWRPGEVVGHPSPDLHTECTSSFHESQGGGTCTGVNAGRAVRRT